MSGSASASLGPVAGTDAAALAASAGDAAAPYAAALAAAGVGRCVMGPGPRALLEGRPVVAIKNLIGGVDKIAREAVLTCIHACEVHIAPHGTQSKRIQEAENELKARWGYSLAGRTMWENVLKMMADHIKEQNRRDGETGTEYDEDDVGVCENPRGC